MSSGHLAFFPVRENLSSDGSRGLGDNERRAPPHSAVAALVVTHTCRAQGFGSDPGVRRPWPGGFVYAGEVGFPAVPDPIRGVPLSSQTRGLQARIRGSRKRSLPRGPIREARWRGTEGTGPILTAASLSHSPARRPAHLGRFSGSARFSLAHPIRRTLDDARPSRPSPSLRCRSRGGQARAWPE